MVATVNPVPAKINNNDNFWSTTQGTRQDNKINLDFNSQNNTFYCKGIFNLPTKNAQLNDIQIDGLVENKVFSTTANITNNGQYLPEDFNPATGDPLPEPTKSLAKFITQLNVDVPQTINPLETLTNKELIQSNIVDGKITVSNLMNDSQNNSGITKNSTLIPKLTTVTNKRLTSSNVTVSDIIEDQTSLGLSRTSTLILDPPVNYGFCNITNNGNFVPSNFNSSGNYDPTHSAGWEYINQINVNVPREIFKYKKSLFTISSSDGYTLSRTIDSNQSTLTINNKHIFVIFSNSNNELVIEGWRSINRLNYLNITANNNVIFEYSNGVTDIGNVVLKYDNNLIAQYFFDATSESNMVSRSLTRIPDSTLIN